MLHTRKKSVEIQNGGAIFAVATVLMENGRSF
jgi:hypothetical protein